MLFVRSHGDLLSRWSGPTDYRGSRRWEWPPCLPGAEPLPAYSGSAAGPQAWREESEALLPGRNFRLGNQFHVAHDLISVVPRAIH